MHIKVSNFGYSFIQYLKQQCIMETPRKKRKAFSVKDKLDALDRIKSGCLSAVDKF